MSCWKTIPGSVLHAQIAQKKQIAPKKQITASKKQIAPKKPIEVLPKQIVAVSRIIGQVVLDDTYIFDIQSLITDSLTFDIF
jgi:hypothetical protein